MYNPAHCSPLRLWSLCNVQLFFPLRLLVLFWFRQNLYLILPLLTDSLKCESWKMWTTLPCATLAVLTQTFAFPNFFVVMWRLIYSSPPSWGLWALTFSSPSCWWELLSSGSICGAFVVYARQNPCEHKLLTTFPLMSFHTQI